LVVVPSGRASTLRDARFSSSGGATSDPVGCCAIRAGVFGSDGPCERALGTVVVDGLLEREGAVGAGRLARFEHQLAAAAEVAGDLLDGGASGRSRA
jgi:hypothetical protein